MISRKKGPKVMLEEEASVEQLEKARGNVMKLFNYIKEYDEKSKSEMGDIKNPIGIIIYVQASRKFERGSALQSHLVSLGSFNYVAVLEAITNWAKKSLEEAMLGEEIE